MKQILRLLVAIGVITFAVSITAVSCGKTAGGGNNSGSGNNGGGGCTGICPTTNLVLIPDSPPLAWVKVSGDTVTINAAGLAAAAIPLSDADPANRGAHDATAVDQRTTVFKIIYPGIANNVGMYFVVGRSHVTKDTITMPATVTELAKCPSNEDTENTLAAAGNAACIVHYVPANRLYFYNYLGTVFNNTDTANHARGIMQCNATLFKDVPLLGSNEVISDTTIFNRDSVAICDIVVVNNDGGASAAEIDDAWVTHAASTTEVEFYAIGIDVSGKTIPQFSNAPGYGFTEFKKAHDNAAFKRLLQNNEWGELRFKVKIVTAADFTAGP